MPHGSPDWGWRGPKKTTYGLDDEGELAVRLGSPVLFDRRGDVVWMTDFRHGWGDCWGFGTAGYETRLLTGYYPRQGAYCVGLYLPVLVSGSVGIVKYLSYPVSSLVGLEATVDLPETVNYWGWHLLVRRGLTELRAYVHYNVVTDVLEYQTTAGAWVQFAAGLNLEALGLCAVTGKVVADIATEEYIRFILNEVEYPLTGAACYIQGAVQPRRFQAEVVAWNVDDDAMETHVDSVIVTQNEPA